jgi:hypothetical protein
METIAGIAWQEFGLAGLFGVFAIIVGWRVFSFIDKTQATNGEMRQSERTEFLGHLKEEREQRKEIMVGAQQSMKEVGKSLSDLNVTIQKMNGD